MTPATFFSKLLTKKAITKMKAVLISLVIIIASIIAVTAYYYLSTPPVVTPPQKTEWPGSLEEAAKPYRGQTVNVLMPSDSWNDYVRKYIAPEFERVTGIKVNHETLPWGPLEEKLTAELSAGTGAYDLVMVGGIGGPEYAKNGWVIDLGKFLQEHPWLIDPEVKLEEICKIAWEMNKFPGLVGGPYAIPVYVYPYFQAYRQSWFEKEGLNPPITYEDWLEAMDHFTRDTDGDGVIDQFALALPFPGASFGLFEALWNIMQVVGLNIYEDHLNNKYMPLIDSPLGREALYLFVTIAKQYSMQGIERMDFFEVNSLYTGQKAAMTWNWIPLGLGEQIGKPEWSWLINDCGWSPIPTRDGRVGGLIYVTGIGIATASPRKEAAWLYLQYLLEKENQIKITPYAGAPIRLDILEVEDVRKAVPFTDTILKLYESPRVAYPRPFTFNGQQEIITRVCLRLLAGEITVEEAADQMQKEICDLFLEVGNINSTEYEFAYKGWKDVQPIGLNKYIDIPPNYFDWVKKLHRCTLNYDEVRKKAIEGWIP